MKKLFPKFLIKGNHKAKTSAVNIPVKQNNEKSKPMIVIGFVISLSSIFLLLFTINNKFG